jgi:hypothetical protein
LAAKAYAPDDVIAALAEFVGDVAVVEFFQSEETQLMNPAVADEADQESSTILGNL